MANKIKILVCTHKQGELPKDDIYLPIQAGKAISGIDLGIQGDDSGDNISEKNRMYCEMTAAYWAWKNIKKIYPNIEYIGLCHYRRFFTFQNILIKHIIKKILIYFKNVLYAIFDLNKSYRCLDGQIIKSFEEGKKLISSFNKDILLFLTRNKVDILATIPVKFSGITVGNFFSVIGRHHIELLKEIVNDSYTEYYISLIKVLNGFILSAANMFIMKTIIFDDYCSFIFSVLEKHILLSKERQIYIDPDKEKSYERILGYLSELLTYCFIIQRMNDKNIIIRYCNKLFISN